MCIFRIQNNWDIMSQLCFISSNVVQYSPNSTTSVFSHSCQPDLGKITLIDSSDAISACLTTPSHCAKVNMGVRIFFSSCDPWAVVQLLCALRQLVLIFKAFMQVLTQPYIMNHTWNNELIGLKIIEIGFTFWIQ